MDRKETCRPVWPEYDRPLITYGLSYPNACAKHVSQVLKASRIYILVSESLSRNGHYLQELKNAIGTEKVASVRVGMRPHTMYSEIIEIAKELQMLKVDCLITLGGGSLTDGGKAAILVSLRIPSSYSYSINGGRLRPLQTM